MTTSYSRAREELVSAAVWHKSEIPILGKVGRKTVINLRLAQAVNWNSVSKSQKYTGKKNPTRKRQKHTSEFWVLLFGFCY